MRIRITIRGEKIELQGFLDVEGSELNDFADAMEPFGLVIASPVEDDYNPFEVARLFQS